MNLPANDTFIEVTNVYKSYKLKRQSLLKHPEVVQAVRGISFAIKKGEVFGCVGESGCGKSTTARLLVKMDQPTSGTITINNQDIVHLKGAQLKDFRRRVQMVLQDPFSSLPAKMTIREILMEPLLIHGTANRAECEDKVRKIAGLIKLDLDDLEKLPSAFSGGQRQMINIGRAIILEPELVILDEATSALDNSVQADILNLFDDLKKAYGLTYVVISHDLAMVRHMCDTIGVMYLGKFVEYGANEDIFFNPLHPYTKSLLASIPSIETGIKGLREGNLLRGEVPSPINPPAGCSFCSRCPAKTDICEQVEPELRQVTANQAVACHHV